MVVGIIIVASLIALILLITANIVFGYKLAVFIVKRRTTSITIHKGTYTPLRERYDDVLAHWGIAYWKTVQLVATMCMKDGRIVDVFYGVPTKLENWNPQQCIAQAGAALGVGWTIQDRQTRKRLSDNGGHYKNAIQEMVYRLPEEKRPAIMAHGPRILYCN